MLNKLYSIAANTFLETIRQPIYGVLLVVTVFAMILNLALSAYTLDNDDILLLESQLSTLMLSGLFLAAFSASTALGREIENKTALTVVSKPVGRTTFFLGKFCGLVGAVGIAMCLLFLVFLLVLRHQVLQNSTDPFDGPVLVFGFIAVLLAVSIAAYSNYMHGHDFTSRAVLLAAPFLTVAVALTGFFGKTWTPQPFNIGIIDKQYAVGALLVVLAVFVLAAVALTASTRLGQAMTMLVCVLVLAAGLVSDYVLTEYAARSGAIAAVYRVIPNFGVLDVGYALTTKVHIPADYVLRAVGYCLCLLTGTLMLGIALFQRREVG